jgi:hypothetical protein
MTVSFFAEKEYDLRFEQNLHHVNEWAISGVHAWAKAGTNAFARTPYISFCLPLATGYI